MSLLERFEVLMAEQKGLWWRVSILEPGGRTVEVDAPSGASLADWQAFAARYHSAGCVVTPIAGLPKARAPVPLDKALARACGVGDTSAGITPMQFRALLSREDITDIEGGDLPVETLRAYALSFAEGMRSGRIGASDVPSPGPGVPC